MNFYVAIVAIGMGVSLAQADTTYSIRAMITSIEGIDAVPVPCDAESACWLMDLHGDDKLQLGAQVEVTERTGRTAYSNIQNSTLLLCKSYGNDTWEAAVTALLVEAMFPTQKKTCPLDATHPYLVYQKMDPVTVTLKNMLDCNDYLLSANIGDDYFQDEGPDGQRPLGKVNIVFTIPDNGDCIKA